MTHTYIVCLCAGCSGWRSARLASSSDMVLTWCSLALYLQQGMLVRRDAKLWDAAKKGNDFECKALVLAGANLNYTNKVRPLPLASEAARAKQSTCAVAARRRLPCARSASLLFRQCLSLLACALMCLARGCMRIQNGRRAGQRACVRRHASACMPARVLRAHFYVYTYACKGRMRAGAVAF